ncbi:MAG TPA: response regulator [Candidatus Peribacterales bacterium]|nr:response regulator [Candidatus Peribacterales bacterium]
MPKQSILIAEDDPCLRAAYERRFRRLSFNVHVVEDGEQALKFIEHSPPDLFICDIMMPKLDGWGVLSKLTKEKRPFPVIMLTNLEDDKTRQTCKDMCVDGHLIKREMSLASLCTLVNALLKQRSE